MSLERSVRRAVVVGFAVAVLRGESVKIDCRGGVWYSRDSRGRIAQWQERYFHTVEVAGSSPAAPTIPIYRNSFPSGE